MVTPPLVVTARDARAAGSERRRNVIAEAALQRDGEVDVDAAVDSARIEHSGVVVGHRHPNAAVVRFDVEPGAVPAIAFEIHGDAAVGRLAADVAAHVGQRHAAIARAEFGRSAEVVNRDAAVDRAQRDHRGARHLNVEADGPRLAVAIAVLVAHRRPLGANGRARRINADGRGERPCLGFGIGICSDSRAHEHVGPVPSAHLDAAVLAGVDLQRVHALQRRLADLTMPNASASRAVPAPIIVRHAPARLCRGGARYGRRRRDRCRQG